MRGRESIDNGSWPISRNDVDSKMFGTKESNNPKSSQIPSPTVSGEKQGQQIIIQPYSNKIVRIMSNVNGLTSTSKLQAVPRLPITCSALVLSCPSRKYLCRCE